MAWGQDGEEIGGKTSSSAVGSLSFETKMSEVKARRTNLAKEYQITVCFCFFG